jgi:hypothetical protein
LAIAGIRVEFEEESMLDARHRPEGRLFYWLLSTVVIFLVWSGISAPVADGNVLHGGLSA